MSRGAQRQRSGASTSTPATARAHRRRPRLCRTALRYAAGRRAGRVGGLAPSRRLHSADGGDGRGRCSDELPGLSRRASRRRRTAATGWRCSRRTQSAGRVRAARDDLSPAHDGRDRSATTGSRRRCAPAARFLEPLQGGARQEARHPQALGADALLRPRRRARRRRSGHCASSHSRADGARHGVTSLVERGGDALRRRERQRASSSASRRRRMTGARDDRTDPRTARRHQGISRRPRHQGRRLHAASGRDPRAARRERRRQVDADQDDRRRLSS